MDTKPAAYTRSKYCRMALRRRGLVPMLLCYRRNIRTLARK
jgi:hypothetical protein